MKTAIRVALYARVSLDNGSQDPRNQLFELRRFARKQGWQVVTEYIEKVTGSGKKARPQFDACMLAASQRKFDLLLFWALDRLSREGIVKTIGYLEDLQAWGVGWRSYSQPFLDSGNKMTTGIVLAVLAAVAEQERITISDRTKAGLVRARVRLAKVGRTLGRPRKTIDLAAARALRAQGATWRAIGDKFNVSPAFVWLRLKRRRNEKTVR
jgi:DNA invertase Pin-like site-specific DNA recombinase